MNNEIVLAVRLKVLNSCAMLTEEDLIDVHVLVNGAEAGYDVLAPMADPIEVVAVLNCAQSPIEMTYGATVFGQTISQFNWNFGNSTTATGNAVEAVYAEDGVFPVIVELTTVDGCVYTASTNVTVLPSPQVSFTSTLDMENLTAVFENTTFVLNSTIGTTDWDFGDGASSSEFETSHVYGAMGAYDVTLTVTTIDGCSASLTQEIEFTIGVEENTSINNVHVYPNPFDTYLMIESQSNIDVTVVDVTGRVVKQMFLVVGGNKHSLDMSDLAGGSYLVKCSGKDFEKAFVVCHKR
jgi:PKD repeat protein